METSGGVSSNNSSFLHPLGHVNPEPILGGSALAQRVLNGDVDSVALLAAEQRRDQLQRQQQQASSKKSPSPGGPRVISSASASLSSPSPIPHPNFSPQRPSSASRSSARPMSDDDDSGDAYEDAVDHALMAQLKSATSAAAATSAIIHGRRDTKGPAPSSSRAPPQQSESERDEEGEEEEEEEEDESEQDEEEQNEDGEEEEADEDTLILSDAEVCFYLSLRLSSPTIITHLHML